MKHEQLSNREAASKVQTLKRDLAFAGTELREALGGTQVVDERLAGDCVGRMALLHLLAVVWYRVRFALWWHCRLLPISGSWRLRLAHTVSQELEFE